MTSRPTGHQPASTTLSKTTPSTRNRQVDSPHKDKEVAKREHHVDGAKHRRDGRPVAITERSNQRSNHQSSHIDSTPASSRPSGGERTASPLNHVEGNPFESPQLGLANSKSDPGVSSRPIQAAPVPGERFRRIVDDAMYADALKTMAEHGTSNSGGESKKQKRMRRFYDAVDLLKTFVEGIDL